MTGAFNMAAVDGVLAPSKQRRHDDEPETAKLGRSADSLFRNPRGHGRQRQGVPEVVEPSQEFWEKQEPASVADYLKKTASDFFDILDDYREEANKAADKYWKSSRSHARWRVSIIVATGVLAAINGGAALIPLWGGTTLSTSISALAALCAAALAVAANIENFLSNGQKAANFRESRELLLGRHREYYFKWLYYVEAYGESPMACVNAGRLYCGLVNSDQELRQTLKELANVRDSQSRHGPR